MKVELRPGERLDDLLIDGMKLIQRPDEFCFSIDAVLLAHFGSLKKGQRILELGSGTAVIPLLLTALGAKEVTGMELNPVMADIGRRNIQLNGKESSIQLIEGDYRQIESYITAGAYDLVYVNPPYREMGRGAKNEKEGICKACHEVTATLEDVLKAVRYSLKYRGRLRMIHLASRLSEILEQLHAFDLEPKRLQCIHGREDKASKLVLVEAVRGGHRGLTIEAPLLIYNQDGSYSETVKRWYGK